MPLTTFLEKVKNDIDVSFDETITIISDHYRYQPTEFNNGLNNQTLINTAGSNEGSCKIFAFAQINQLTPQQTLALFGDFYRKDVLENPTETNHQNIRNFIQFGWEGIHFTATALTPK